MVPKPYLCGSLIGLSVRVCSGEPATGLPISTVGLGGCDKGGQPATRSSAWVLIMKVLVLDPAGVNPYGSDLANGLGRLGADVIRLASSSAPSVKTDVTRVWRVAP